MQEEGCGQLKQVGEGGQGFLPRTLYQLSYSPMLSVSGFLVVVPPNSWSFWESLFLALTLLPSPIFLPAPLPTLLYTSLHSSKAAPQGGGSFCPCLSSCSLSPVGWQLLLSPSLSCPWNHPGQSSYHVCHAAVCGVSEGGGSAESCWLLRRGSTTGAGGKEAAQVCASSR